MFARLISERTIIIWNLQFNICFPDQCLIFLNKSFDCRTWDWPTENLQLFNEFHIQHLQTLHVYRGIYGECVVGHCCLHEILHEKYTSNFYTRLLIAHWHKFFLIVTIKMRMSRHFNNFLTIALPFISI